MSATFQRMRRASETEPKRNTGLAEAPAGSPWVQRLQIISNLIVIATCLGAGAAIGFRWSQTESAEPPSYTIGEAVDEIPGVDFGAAARTLVMVLREECRFCRESVPFYRQLTSDIAQAEGVNVKVVVASSDPTTQMSAYLNRNEIRTDRVANVKPGDLKVPGTPFLMLLDRHGVVLNLWRGQIPTAQEKEVYQALGLN